MVRDVIRRTTDDGERQDDKGACVARQVSAACGEDLPFHMIGRPKQDPNIHNRK